MQNLNFTQARISRMSGRDAMIRRASSRTVRAPSKYNDWKLGGKSDSDDPAEGWQGYTSEDAHDKVTLNPCCPSVPALDKSQLLSLRSRQSHPLGGASSHAAIAGRCMSRDDLDIKAGRAACYYLLTRTASSFALCTTANRP